MALTIKQRAFVREYLKDYNASAAAERAGYSPKTAAQQGSRLLKNADVQKQIGKFQDKADTNTILTIEELREWWSDAVRGRHNDATYKDRQKASELLGKSLGGFTDRVEQSGSTTIHVIYDDAE